MKPQRQLAIPCRPCFVDEMRKGEACVKIPETRLDKLFKTERFKEFLRTHLDWLRPECRIQPNSEVVICRSDILPERIREEDANDRDKRQFEEDFESAKQESTGERAWNLYNEYKQRHVVIEGEDIAKRFLTIAYEKNFKEAKAVQRDNIFTDEARSCFDEQELRVIEKICRDRHKFVVDVDEKYRRYYQGKSVKDFALTWYGDENASWGRFRLPLERANFDSTAFANNAIEFAIAKYDRLNIAEKESFLVFLQAVAECPKRDFQNAKTNAFVRLLANSSGDA